MKQLIFSFLFLIPTLATAQDQIDSTVTTYDNRGGVFYLVTRTAYSSGRITTDETPLGTDTTAVTNAIVGPVFSAASQLATRAAEVARLNRFRAQINAASVQLTNIARADYYDVMERLIGNEFLNPGNEENGGQFQPANYTMRIDGAPVTVTIRRNTAGKLILRQGTQNFAFDIVARNWIRIRRYQGTETLAPEGTVVELFQEKNGRFISLDLKYDLRKQ